MLHMVRKCGERDHSDAAVRTTLDEAALQWGRTKETEVVGRYDLIDAEKYTRRVAVPTPRQQQLVVRRRPGPLAGGEAALRKLPVQRIGALRSTLARVPSAKGGSVVCNIRTSRDLQLAMELLA